MDHGEISHLSNVLKPADKIFEAKFNAPAAKSLRERLQREKQEDIARLDKIQNSRQQLEAIAHKPAQSTFETRQTKPSLPTEPSYNQKLRELMRHDPDFVRSSELQTLQKLNPEDPKAQAIVFEAYDRYKMTGSSKPAEPPKPSPKTVPQREEIKRPKIKPQEKNQDQAREKRKKQILLQHNLKSSVAHEILGVSSSATEEEIRFAYQVLAGRYHPDVSEYQGGNFRKVTEARDALMKKLKKPAPQPSPVSSRPQENTVRRPREQSKQKPKTDQEIHEDVQRENQSAHIQARDEARRIHIYSRKENRRIKQRAESQIFRQKSPEQLLEQALWAESINELIAIAKVIKDRYLKFKFAFPGDPQQRTTIDVLANLRKLKTCPKAERDITMRSITRNDVLRRILQKDLAVRDEGFDLIRGNLVDVQDLGRLRNAVDKMQNIRINEIKAPGGNSQHITADMDELEESADWFYFMARDATPEDVHRETLRVTHAYDLDLKMYYVIRNTVWTSEMRQNNPVPKEIRERYLHFLANKKE